MSTLDLSNYSHDAALARHGSVRAWMKCLKANGVTRIIVNAWDLEKSRAMVRGARDEFIACEDIYCFLYYGLPHERHEVDNALVLVKSEGLSFAWPDCESHWRPDTPTEAEGITTGYRIATTAKLRAELLKAGYQTGIYTGEDWWIRNMGNFDGFSGAGDSLWLANYGSNDPANPRPPITDVDFGGWKHPIAHQYSSTIEVCGRTEDHNYWFMEDPMTPDEKAAMQRLQAQVERLNAIVAGNGTFPVVANQGNILALAYALDAGSIQPGKLYSLTGEQTLRYYARQGNNLALGLLITQGDLGKLAAEVDEATDYAGERLRTSQEVALLADKYDAIAEGISALDAALESLRAPGDTDPKEPTNAKP